MIFLSTEHAQLKMPFVSTFSISIEQVNALFLNTVHTTSRSDFYLSGACNTGVDLKGVPYSTCYLYQDPYQIYVCVYSIILGLLFAFGILKNTHIKSN